MVLQMAQKMGLPMERKSVVQRAGQKVTQRDTMKDLPMAGHWGNMKAVCWGYKMVAHWAEQKVAQKGALMAGLSADRRAGRLVHHWVQCWAGMRAVELVVQLESCLGLKLVLHLG
jgi:hypothetical protein